MDLDLQVLSPCLTEAGGGGGIAAGPQGGTGKKPRLLTPRTGLFQVLLGNTQEAWELSSERWLSLQALGWQGSASEPKCYPFAPVNLGRFWGLPGGLLGAVPSPFPSVWARNICAQQQDLHTGGLVVGSRALICNP